MKKIILLPVLFLSVYLMETLAETSYATRIFENRLRENQMSQNQSQDRKNPALKTEDLRFYQKIDFEFLEKGESPEFIHGFMPGNLVPVNCVPIENQAVGVVREMKDNYYKWMFFRLFLWIMLIIMATIIYYSIVNSIQVYGRNKNAALEILKSRYAWGGITKDEFWRMKKELQS
jgi:uncharacterized membrane protein